MVYDYADTVYQYSIRRSSVRGPFGADGLETVDGWEARRVGVGRRRRRRIASMPCQLVVGSWRMWFPVVSALALSLARAPTQRCGCSGGVV
jgi:hypothetical protein